MIAIKFLIINKKDKLVSELINEELLNSVNAPSLIAKNVIKHETGNFMTYIYTYNHVYDECENIFYKCDENSTIIVNGLIALNDKDTPTDVEELFNEVNNGELNIGDFQLIKLTSDNNGIVYTPNASSLPLFYYEDEYCFLVSNELKLIVDGLTKFSNNKFSDFYDVEYINDLIQKGDGKKSTHRNTLFYNIKRVLPQDEIRIENNNLIITEHDEIKVPSWFEDWYFEDKDSLYDWYVESLLKYSDDFFKIFKDDVFDIGCPITGGFDSRLAISVLSIFSKKYNIKLSSSTVGSDDLPDVVIGKRVANTLNIPWQHQSHEKFEKYLPSNFEDYASVVFQSQGDWYSYDYFQFEYGRNNIKDHKSFSQTGLDLYKRDNFSSIIKYNRWFSRRVLTNSNFFLPLFATNLELNFALLYSKHFPEQEMYKEFVYEVLKRINPELLEIPFAFDKLPQLDIEEYTDNSFKHNVDFVKPFLWDYQFVVNELSPIYAEEFNYTNEKHDRILTKLGINPFDYMMFKEDFDKAIKKGNENRIIEIKLNAYYPLCRKYVDLNTDKYHLSARLLRIMDFAVGASFSSYDEIEKVSSFYKDKANYTTLNAIEEFYYEQNKFMSSNNLYKYVNSKNKQIKKLKSKNKNLNQKNSEILSSNSWKITKPLRWLKNKFSFK